MKKPAGGCSGILAPTRKRQLRIERLEARSVAAGKQEQAPQARIPPIRDHVALCNADSYVQAQVSSIVKEAEHDERQGEVGQVKEVLFTTDMFFMGDWHMSNQVLANSDQNPDSK